MENENPLLKTVVYREPEGRAEERTGSTEHEFLTWSEEGFNQYLRLLHLQALRDPRRDGVLEHLSLFIAVGLLFILMNLIASLAPFRLQAEAIWMVFLLGLICVLLCGIVLPKVIYTIPRDRRIRPVVYRYVKNHPHLLPALRSLDDNLAPWLDKYLSVYNKRENNREIAH